MINIVTKGTILKYCEKYPSANTALEQWYYEFRRFDFKHFNDLKAIYPGASILTNGRVIFNIKGNEFRLIVRINFFAKALYIIWFGTHKEYNKIDAATIAFKD
jgi:mRNA interferase HigB